MGIRSRHFFTSQFARLIWRRPFIDSMLKTVSSSPFSHWIFDKYGDEAKAILHIYTQEVEKDLEKMSKALSVQKIDDVCNLAHKIKGASSIVGAEQVEKDAHTIEKYTRHSHDTHLLATRISKLQSSFQVIKSYIKTFS